ncbi:MAG: hypothetical protein ACPL5F_09660 [Moorellaceae bacterium]
MQALNRKVAAAIERAVPAVIEALVERAARGDARVKRLLEEVLRNAKGGCKHVRVSGKHRQAD